MQLFRLARSATIATAFSLLAVTAQTGCEDSNTSNTNGQDAPPEDETFCDVYERTCGPWSGDVPCADWWDALPLGAPEDRTSRSRSCVAFHLERAQTTVSNATECAAARGEAPCLDTSPNLMSPDMSTMDMPGDLSSSDLGDVATADMSTMLEDIRLDAEADTDTGTATIGELCFPDRFDPTRPGPNYDQFQPRVGAHCLGTNHQHIFGIEEVVFLGDSVTVGTPNLNTIFTVNDFFRSQVADRLAAQFALDPPSDLWKSYCADPTGILCEQGTSVEQTSGDFRNCSKWGGRTDDLLRGGNQIGTCFPNDGSDKRTLVIMTMGGNDIKKITEEGGEGTPVAEVRQIAEQAIADLEEAVAWFREPGRFPNGVFLIFANPFEFTDGTGDVTSCPVAGIVGLEDWEDPAALSEMVVWFNEQYMRIATENQFDMIWMLEHFCGHGFVATGDNADTTAACYLGPNTERWFDDTCTHPNPSGHQAITNMFMAVIDEPGMP